MGEIRFNDRTLVLGYTGSGKSELLNLLTTQLLQARGAQVLLFDTKPEFAVPGVTPAGSVREIDWDQPIIHVQLSAPTVAEVEKLFKILKHRRRLVVVVHELSDLCEYNAGAATPSVNAFLSKGRVFGLGLIGGSQRPVNIPKRCLTDADHVFIYAGGFPEPADMKAAAAAAGLSVAEMTSTLEDLHRTYGDQGHHAFVHVDRRERSVSRMAPLHEAERASITIDRPELY